MPTLLPMKKIFFTLFSVICLLLSSLTGCKKDTAKANDNPEYYLKFKLNGNQVTWTNALSELGADLDDNTKTDFAFQGTSNDMKESFGISFQVDGLSLKEGSYSSDDYFMSGIYTISQNNSTTWYDFSYNEPHSKYTITLTAITPAAIKGNFNGNFLADSESDKTIAITEGEFFLKRIR